MKNLIESFLNFINQRVQITKEIEQELHDVCRIENYKKGDLILKEGMIAHHLHFLLNGTARTFYWKDGKDITSWIYREGQIITSWGSFYSRRAAHENVEMVEDAVVCSISFEQMQRLYDKYPKIQIFGRLLAEEQIIYLDYFYKGFMFMTAKEKYELLISTFPDVAQRVNLGHIASLLGITQETLSRIRKR